MSQDFQKVLVKDDRLMVTDSVKYAVIKGGSNMTCSQYQAISQSPSSVTFNIQVPSQETVISRNALVRTTLTFTVQAKYNAAYDAGVGGAGYPMLDYGQQDAFAAFPFNQCVNSVQWTINNNTVSQNTREILPTLLRIHDKRWLSRYNGMTPTMYDTYGSYNDAVGANNNPLGNWQNSASLDNDLIPRGCFPARFYYYAGTTLTLGVPSLTAAAPTQTCYIDINVTEPVLVSPWTFAGDDSCGMYGIQNLNAIYNLTSVANTAFRMANTDSRFTAVNGGASSTAPIVTLFAVNNTQLLLQYLTPHPSDLMPSRNCLPYYELPRYLTSNLPALGRATSNMFITQNLAQTAPVAIANTATSSSGPAPVYNTTSDAWNLYNGGLPSFIGANGLPASVSLVSQSLQLNQIPDKIYITVGYPQTSPTKTCAFTDSFASIANISINWNNSSGLLSSATQQDLWRMSVENGINQSWQEFQGYTAGIITPKAVTYTALNNAGAAAVPITIPAGTPTYIQTCGSVLCLEFGKDIELKDDYYAPGSLGNFQLQFNLGVYNTSPLYDISTGYVIQTIIQNSGVFSLERGVASSYLGILTKSDVLEASRDKPYAYSDAIRMVGGAAGASSGFFKRLMGTMGRIAPKMLHEGIDDFVAHKGKGESGGGVSGAGVSGAGQSGGRRHRKGMGALEDRLY